MAVKRQYECTVITTEDITAVCTFNKPPPLEFLQLTVGGYIERVEIQYKGKKWCNMWINEEGRIINLPFNPKATALCKGELARYNSEFEPDFYQIYGNICIVRPVKVTPGV